MCILTASILPTDQYTEEAHTLVRITKAQGQVGRTPELQKKVPQQNCDRELSLYRTNIA